MNRERLIGAFATTARRRLQRVHDLVEDAVSDSGRLLRRELHSLGGEAAFLGFSSVHAMVVEAEAIAADWPVPARPELDTALRALFREIGHGLPTVGDPLVPGPPRALLVGDSVAHAWVLRDVLEHEGWETRVVTELESAGDCRGVVVLCCVTDIRRFDAVVQEARERRAKAVVLVADPRFEAEIRQIGADGFVSTAKGMVATVAELLSQLGARLET